MFATQRSRDQNPMFQVYSFNLILPTFHKRNDKNVYTFIFPLFSSKSLDRFKPCTEFHASVAPAVEHRTCNAVSKIVLFVLCVLIILTNYSHSNLNRGSRVRISTEAFFFRTVSGDIYPIRFRTVLLICSEYVT